MKIDKNILAESNYEGSRLIEIKDKKVYELQKELNAFQKEINPILEKLSVEYYPKVDPLYAELGELNNKTKELRSKIAEHTERFKEDTQNIEAIEQKAQNVKNKIQPIIAKELEGQLGEFEIARHTQVIGDVIYVEVFDEIEEKVKAIRANKANTPKI